MYVSDFGLSTGHWLNYEPSFCRQATDLVRVSDFGLPTVTHWLNRDSLSRAQAADLLRVSHIGLLKSTCCRDLSPLRGPIDPIVTPFFVCAGCGLAACGLPGALVDSTTAFFYVHRLRTWCVYLILRSPGAPIDSAEAH